MLLFLETYAHLTRPKDDFLMVLGGAPGGQKTIFGYLLFSYVFWATFGLFWDVFWDDFSYLGRLWK